MRILAADDDPSLLRALERWLRSWGYEPVCAHDGLEAWKLLKREDTPGVVILDWDMPGLSGTELCRLLRSTPHGADVYVLMLTARQTKDDTVAALESGADDFLTKPFHARELQLRLAKGVRDATRARLGLFGGASRESRSTLPPTGATLGGKYRLERKLAKGGMGSVWVGVHLSLGVNVAIKFMDAALAETAEYASFEREARAAAQLRNENIVRVYDHGISEEGVPYLVMEYIEGESLSDRIDRLGPLAPSEVVAVVAEAARALGAAHARDIIHRDIKPENILLVEDADKPAGFSVKLIDFGLANPAGHNPGDRTKIAGTPSYMSPEYLRGEVPPSPLLDLWGLAATAFVALTGNVAFDGQSLSEVMQRVCTAPLPVPSRLRPGLPTTVNAWFARACARSPRARFQSATELALALREACPTSYVPPDEGPMSADERMLRPLRKATPALAQTEPDSSASLPPPASSMKH